MLVKQKKEGSNISIIQYKEFSDIDVNELEELFKDFYNQGVILNSSYADEKWMLFNERNQRNVSFTLDELAYNREAKSREIASYMDIVKAIKAFALFKLKSHPIDTVYNSVSFIKRCVKETSFFKKEKINMLVGKKFKKDYGYYSLLHYLIEFLEFFPSNIDEQYFNLLYHQSDSYYQYVEDSQFKNRREIGNFESMFELGYAIDLFWETCTIEEKEKFYPIKLWWEITTIIPLRTTELILTPYNCISEKDGKYYLTVRRTELKGNNGTSTHKIDSDYKLHTIRINKKLYTLINDYRSLVDNYDFEEEYFYQGYDYVGRRDFLFSQRAYYKHLDFKGATKKSYILEYLNYANLKRLLITFYNQILVNKFNYEIVPKADRANEKEDDDTQQEVSSLKPYQIEQLSLMDTRHFAFINLVLNDIEPLFIKDISGHAKFQSSYHYYSHVNKFVKCYTYSMAKRLARKETAKKGETVIDVRKSSHSSLVFKKVFDNNFEEDIKSYKDINGGKCSSRQKLFEDCNANAFACEDCQFFHPTQSVAQERIKKKFLDNQNRLNTEAKALEELVKQFGKVKSFEEDYGTRINRIKTIALQNSVMLSKYFE